MSDAHDSSDAVPEILDSHAPTGAAPSDVLPAADAGAPRGTHRGRWIAVVAGVAAVAVVAAGGVAVGLSLSGGGTQPEQLVPANAIFYADVDLDPSASQKVNAVRFLRHFPAASKQLGPTGDVRGLLGQALDGLPISQNGQLPSWLGQRFGLALLPGAGGAQTPIPEVVLQVTDENAARTSLTWAFQTGASVAVADGYAVVTQDPASAQGLIDKAHEASLASSQPFTDAMAPLGDGVASFYLDTAGMAKLEQQLAPMLGLPTAQPSNTPTGGVAAGVVRFQPDAVELVASAPSTATSDVPATLVSTLPDSTVVAVGGSSSAALIKAQTATLVQRLSTIGGLGGGSLLSGLEPGASRLPQDLLTLFGDQMAVSADGSGLATNPKIGFLSKTDVASAQPAVTDVMRLFHRQGTTIVSRSTTDTVVLANDPSYAAELAAQDGTLGASAPFRSAVPDAAGASLVAFINLSAIFASTGNDDPNAQAFGSLGVSAHETDGRTSYLVRLTVTGG